MTITAPEGAALKGYDQSKLSAPTAEPNEIDIDNQDPNVQHNVVVFDGPDDSASVRVEGTLIAGPSLGSALRSSLPFGVSGKASRAIAADGTITSGRISPTCLRKASPLTSAPRRNTT